MKNELVKMDLDIEVLEHRVEMIAPAGGCTSSSSSCSNIVVIEVVLELAT